MVENTSQQNDIVKPRGLTSSPRSLPGRSAGVVRPDEWVAVTVRALGLRYVNRLQPRDGSKGLVRFSLLPGGS